MSFKHIVRSWITTLVSVALFIIITYKTYLEFETLTMAQVLVIGAMYLIAGGLMFASDKFFKESFGKLANKITK